ncbi:MAG: hypothetical protein EOM68_31370, partial [Spirochaetia bacterium]|nr:hypothetical protein [Spirochaetia bacterium]
MAGQYSPTLGSMMQMLAPMIRAQTGVDIRTLANPLMPSSNMRRFNAMDALMMNDYTTPFRHGIYGPSRGNMAGDILNQGYYQLLQDSRQAEAALGRSLQAAGAGYSFATSTGLNRQTIAQAMGRGRAPADVFASFSTFSQMDGPMNMGERGLMLEQMVGSGMMNGFS